MQSSVPEVADLSAEPKEVLESYGPDVEKPGSFAANCLMARRLAERGVRFIQLYHQDWDHHGGLPGALPSLCKETDQPSAALVKDLKRTRFARGYAGDLGRRVRTNQLLPRKDTTKFWSRPSSSMLHHVVCRWRMRPGYVHGETDEFGYNIVANPVHIHDVQATLMHQLGIDHERLTYKFQGRRYRLRCARKCCQRLDILVNCVSRYSRLSPNPTPPLPRWCPHHEYVFLASSARHSKSVQQNLECRPVEQDVGWHAINALLCNWESSLCREQDPIPLKDLDGHFPMKVPSDLEAWKQRSDSVRMQILVSQGLWPKPTFARYSQLFIPSRR